MKVAILDKDLEVLHTFTVLTDAAMFVGKTTKTLNRWKSLGSVYNSGNFILMFNIEVHKATQKAHKTSF